jgi:hypothetical protein
VAQHKGEILNRRYARQAKQARYRENGIWYHPLERFPADLYDANGVIRFESKAQYRKYIRIGPDPNSIHADLVGRGISRIPGYKTLEPRPKTLV